MKEENIQLKGEAKFFDKLEKENIELKEELKEFKCENKLLNDKVQQILTNTTDKFQKVMTDSNNEIKETKNDIMKLCDKQINFAQTVSKDSNKITSSAMTLLGFLQKQCPDNKKATGFFYFRLKKTKFFFA